MNPEKRPSQGPAYHLRSLSREAVTPRTRDDKGEEAILRGQRSRVSPQKQGSAHLQGSPNPQATRSLSHPGLPERTIDASLQAHHLSPSQRGGSGQRNNGFNYESRSRQDKPNMVYSGWTPRGQTPEEFSPFDPAGEITVPTLNTPVYAPGQQIAFAGAGQPMSGEEFLFNQLTQRQLFPNQRPANSSPQKNPQVPQMSQMDVYAKMKGVAPSLAGKSQSSQEISLQ